MSAFTRSIKKKLWHHVFQMFSGWTWKGLSQRLGWIRNVFILHLKNEEMKLTETSGGTFFFFLFLKSVDSEMLVRFIKEKSMRALFPFRLCPARVQKDVSQVNDESSREERSSYYTDLFSIWTLMHCSAFFPCRGHIPPCSYHTAVALPVWVHHLRHDSMPHFTRLSYPTTSLLSCPDDVRHHPPSPPVSSREIWNTVQLWRFNTALSCVAVTSPALTGARAKYVAQKHSVALYLRLLLSLRRSGKMGMSSWSLAI